jgi:multidrug transporter EmrE-like cation transporter
MSSSIKIEDPKSKAILITVICVILVSIGQAFMKYGFNQSATPSEIQFSKEFAKNFLFSFFETPWIIIGYLIAGISSILFLEALHNAEFGITAAVLRLNYIVAYFIGIFYFGESFKIINFIGLLLIFVGVASISIPRSEYP